MLRKLALALAVNRSRALALLSVALVAAALLPQGSSALVASSPGDPPPATLTIEQHPDDPTSQTDATFAFSMAGASGFRCSLEGPVSADWSGCGTGETGNWDTSSSGVLADGRYTFHVEALDTSGASVDSAQYSWTVDTAPPPPPDESPPPKPDITAGPSDGSTTDSDSATFTFTDSESGVTFECDRDGGGWDACDSPKTYSGLADSSHTFSVRAKDAAGNTSERASRTWTVDTTPPAPADTTPPQTRIDAHPSAVTRDPSATFAFSSSESGSRFECRLDGNGWAACDSPRTYSELSSDSHTFSVRATDQAGNTDETPATYRWKVDRTPPRTTITAEPANPSRTTRATFRFSSSESGSTFACKFDGRPWTACAPPKSYSTDDGIHSFAVRATDAAGNADPSPDSFTWTVDTTPPRLSLPPINATEATEPTGAVVTYVATASDDGAPLPVSCAPHSGSTFPLGTTSVRCTATDTAGNSASGSLRVVVVDTSAPTFGVAVTKLTVAATSRKGIAVTDPHVAEFLTAVRASVSDTVDTDPSVNDNAPSSYFPIGETLVTFTATDASANTTEKSYVVRVAGENGTIDFIPPGPILGVRARSGSRLVVLRWRQPRARDFDHVVIMRSLAPLSQQTGAQPRPIRVYRGRARSFTDRRRLVNGRHYIYQLRAIDHAGNRSAPVTTDGFPRIISLIHPLANARVRVPLRNGRLVFRWRTVPRATYYNLQLYRGPCCAHKILSAWPGKTHLLVHAHWHYQHVRRALAPGDYHWYVWPGLGSRRKGAYGPMLGQAAFTVLPREQ